MQLPAPFSKLEPFVDQWALGTERERNHARLTSTKDKTNSTSLRALVLIAGLSSASATLAQNADDENSYKAKYECHTWAIQETGFQPDFGGGPTTHAPYSDRQPLPEAKPAPNERVKNAVVGGLLGSAVGAVAGNAGVGGVVGGLAGALFGGGSKKSNNSRATTTTLQQPLRSREEEIKKADYERAFGTCMQAIDESSKQHNRAHSNLEGSLSADQDTIGTHENISHRTQIPSEGGANAPSPKDDTPDELDYFIVDYSGPQSEAEAGTPSFVLDCQGTHDRFGRDYCRARVSSEKPLRISWKEESSLLNLATVGHIGVSRTRWRDAPHEVKDTASCRQVFLQKWDALPDTSNGFESAKKEAMEQARRYGSRIHHSKFLDFHSFGKGYDYESKASLITDSHNRTKAWMHLRHSARHRDQRGRPEDLSDQEVFEGLLGLQCTLESIDTMNAALKDRQRREAEAKIARTSHQKDISQTMLHVKAAHENDVLESDDPSDKLYCASSAFLVQFMNANAFAGGYIAEGSFDDYDEHLWQTEVNEHSKNWMPHIPKADKARMEWFLRNRLIPPGDWCVETSTTVSVRTFFTEVDTPDPSDPAPKFRAEDKKVVKATQTDLAGQIQELQTLREQGVLTEDEFSAAKKNLLGL